jgi:NADH-quinone oxidoreductase subunit G
MPKLSLDGKEIEFTNQRSILQAAIDAGVEVPHYCYHPGLSAPASCRICLVEVEGMPKLVPACYTPPKDGMVVHCRNSTKAVANQKQVMEFLLVNHPLDCPVCDKAGECGLQDYSYAYGRSQSRFEEDKHKKPKKDVGDHVLLYTDRCIMCTRCVRFTREVSGTSELMVDGRGHREEIEIFPGKPLSNKLSLNVIDICPVGALLDKSFLFQQRVWFLKRTASISPVDAGGENIWIDQNEGVVYRIKPRYNSAVNTWWINDETRHAYKALTDERRLRHPKTRNFGAQAETSWKDAVKEADTLMRATGPKFAVLSPMLPSEEAYLLAKYVRSIDANALLVVGPVPTTADDVFKHSITGKETFRIQGEKVPNRRGIERVIQSLGGPTCTWDEFQTRARERQFANGAGWITGGYLSNWITVLPAGLDDVKLIAQDALPNALTERADVLLPGTLWAEKDGSFENYKNVIQSFAKSIDPIVGSKREADVYLKLLGRELGASAESIRVEMGEPFAQVAPPPSPESVTEPAMEFAEV